MSNQLPLVIKSGEIEQIQSGDKLDISGTVSGDATITAAGVLTVTSLANLKKGCFGVTYDGQGAVITVNNYVEVIIPYTGTITDWVIQSITPSTGADLSGSIVIDIVRSGVSIIGGGNKPTLSSAGNNSAVVSGWTSVAVTAGDKLFFYVVSSTTCVKVNCTINITKT